MNDNTDRVEWKVQLALCTNAETACDGYDVDPWGEEATRDAADAQLIAAEAVALPRGVELKIVDSNLFSDWHGGKYCQTPLSYFRRAWHADMDDEGDDQGDWSPWEWVAPEEVPIAARAGANAAREAADRAKHRVMVEWERRAAEQAAPDA